MPFDVNHYREHLPEIRKQVAQHTEPDGAVYLATRKSRQRDLKGGVVFVVPAEQAPRLIYEETHDFATPEQIEEFKAQHAARKKEIEQEAAVRKQTMQIVLPPEFYAAAAAGGKGKEK